MAIDLKMEQRVRRMKFRVVLTLSLALASSAVGQVNGTPYGIADVLATAHVNGSLSYWGTVPCNYSLRELYPFAPSARRSTSSTGVLDALHEMFADDPKMQITQDADGTVRMFETDVPMDLLNIRLRHVSFDVPDAHGPNMAVRIVLSAREVIAYRKKHKIGPFASLFLVPSDSSNENLKVTGSLNNVKVSQALDYIFKTFPGFWIYGNCPNGGKGIERDVYFWFYRTFPRGSTN